VQILVRAIRDSRQQCGKPGNVGAGKTVIEWRFSGQTQPSASRKADSNYWRFWSSGGRCLLFSGFGRPKDRAEILMSQSRIIFCYLPWQPQRGLIIVDSPNP